MIVLLVVCEKPVSCHLSLRPHLAIVAVAFTIGIAEVERVGHRIGSNMSYCRNVLRGLWKRRDRWFIQEGDGCGCVIDNADHIL